ncbi:MAG TPA: hypothetical protein VG871_15935, partial [Vicinamibacterales bacterium]|nr:hypothetical protein [Vicinamibacterales bacterium]
MRFSILAACLLSSTAAFAQAPPQAIDLGTLGGCCSRATVVNHYEVVAGQSVTPSGDVHAWVWGPETGMIDIGHVASSDLLDAVSGINDRGTVVGQRDFVAFMWTDTSGMQSLGTLPGGTLSRAVAVNFNNLAVGWSLVYAGFVDAFAWTAADGMIDLHTLGGARSWATAVNDNDVVVGYSEIRWRNGLHGFVWQRQTGMIDMDPGDMGDSQAVAINRSDMAVGFVQPTNSGQTHVFTWTAADGMVDIGVPPGMSNAWPTAINDFGTITGYATDANQREYAFAWTEDQGFINVASLSKTSSRAGSVTNLGLVTGTASTSTGGAAAGFVWTALSGPMDLPALAGFDGTTTPVAANDYGWIVGSTGSSPRHATLWQMPFCAAGSDCEPTTVWGDVGPFVYDGTPKAVTCTAEDGFGDGVEGPCRMLYDGRMTPPSDVGTYILSAYFTSADPHQANFWAVGSLLTITCATPSVSWPAPAPIQEGAALGAAQLNATASVPGTFVYVPAAGTVVNAGTQTLSVTFTPSDTRNYCGAVQATSQLIVMPSPGQLSGNGSAGGAHQPYQFSFTATESATGAESGGAAFLFGASQFTSTKLNQILFSHPQSVYPRTVTMQGIGTLNGVRGYSFTMNAVDAGKATDRIGV